MAWAIWPVAPCLVAAVTSIRITPSADRGPLRRSRTTALLAGRYGRGQPLATGTERPGSKGLPASGLPGTGQAADVGRPPGGFPWSAAPQPRPARPPAPVPFDLAFAGRCPLGS